MLSCNGLSEEVIQVLYSVISKSVFWRFTAPHTDELESAILRWLGVEWLEVCSESFPFFLLPPLSLIVDWCWRLLALSIMADVSWMASSSDWLTRICCVQHFNHTLSLLIVVCSLAVKPPQLEWNHSLQQSHWIQLSLLDCLVVLVLISRFEQIEHSLERSLPPCDIMRLVNWHVNTVHCWNEDDKLWC